MQPPIILYRSMYILPIHRHKPAMQCRTHRIRGRK